MGQRHQRLWLRDAFKIAAAAVVGMDNAPVAILAIDVAFENIKKKIRNIFGKKAP